MDQISIQVKSIDVSTAEAEKHQSIHEVYSFSGLQAKSIVSLGLSPTGAKEPDELSGYVSSPSMLDARCLTLRVKEFRQYKRMYADIHNKLQAKADRSGNFDLALAQNKAAAQTRHHHGGGFVANPNEFKSLEVAAGAGPP